MVNVGLKSGKWPPKSCGVVLHFHPLRVLWVLLSTLKGICMEIKLRIKIKCSCCPFGQFQLFFGGGWGGGFEVFVAAFYRRSRGWTELFGKTRFLAEIWIRCSTFHPSGKEDSLFVPLSSRLRKIILHSAPIWTIFASLLELSTFRRTLWLSFRLDWKSKLVALHYNETPGMKL